MNNPTHSDPTDTLRIPADRFEQSPFFECYANENTLLGVAANRFYAADNGEDIEQVYWTLKHKAVLFDVPEKPWQIEGPDALPLLERIFARPIASLEQGRGRYAIACAADGGIFMDGILFRLADKRYWYVQPDGALEQWLAAHKAGFDVEISDPKSRVLQIQGPNSMKIMSAATNGAIDDTMTYFGSGFFDIGGQRLFVSRTGWTGELGYEIYTDGANTDCHRLWDFLFETGSAHGMVFGSLKAMGIRRIEAGILDNLSDFDMSMTPFEANLGAFIDLEKADFIGRTALLEADRKSLLYGIRCPSHRPWRQAEIFDGANCVARVLASEWSPLLDCGIGYVRFNQAADRDRKPLLMKTREGEMVTCEIIDLPFYDAEKRIPRGLQPVDICAILPSSENSWFPMISQATSENKLSLVLAFSAGAWGLYWYPLRTIEATGMAGSWSVVFFNACPLILLCPILLFQFRKMTGSIGPTLLAACMVGLAFTLYANGLVETTIIRATMLYYLTPVWSTLIGVIWLSEPLTRARIIAIGVAFLGLFLLLSNGDSTDHPLNIGDLYSLLSGVFWAIGVATLNRWSNIPILPLATFIFFSTTAISAMFAMFIQVDPLPEMGMIKAALPTATFWSICIFLPCFCIIFRVSQILFPGRVGILTMSEVVVAVVSASILVPQERMLLMQWVGAIAIVTAGLIEVLLGHKKVEEPVHSIYR